MITFLTRWVAPAALLAAACGPTGEPQAPPVAVAGTTFFVDGTAETGLAFDQLNGASGEFFMPEIMGSGAALLDFDADGDLDAYLVQAGRLDPESTEEPPGDRLLRNDLGADGQVRFTDITGESGLSATEYGVGVASGDIDNDGFPDLYLASFGANQMWRNRGDGTFQDVTIESGTADSRWSSGGVFFDYDRDGWLDLYVVSYLDFRVETGHYCRVPSGHRDYCGPHNFRGQGDRLFRNRGDGSFEDVSARAGISTEQGRGLGAVTLDANGDGWLDLYVANDLQRNLLWLNQGDGTFENAALLRGCAVNATGRAEASMGVVSADFDGDGDEDLFMTHLRGETNTLYRNDGAGFFEDASESGRLGPASLDMTGFGAAVLDVDRDGWLDLLAVNGAVTRLAERAAAGDSYPFGQPNQLFRNRGDGSFEEVPGEASGSTFALFEVSRGAAVGDVDNDGDADVVVTQLQGPARLLLNVAPQSAWLGLRLLDERGRDALGARAEVRLADGRVLHRRVRTDGSYGSARDPRLLFGLADKGRPVEVHIRWPDGLEESWAEVETGRYVILSRGQGAGER